MFQEYENILHSWLMCRVCLLMGTCNGQSQTTGSGQMVTARSLV